MGITKYRDFIKEEFEKIRKQYNMNWVNEDEYGMTLENKYTEIKFFTEKRDSNSAIGFPIVNKQKNEFYNIKGITQHLGIEGAITTVEDKAIIKSLGDIVKITIFVGRVVLERHAFKIFKGDFSELGPGASND